MIAVILVEQSFFWLTSVLLEYIIQLLGPLHNSLNFPTLGEYIGGDMEETVTHVHFHLGEKC